MEVEALQRLASAVRARRAELGLSQEQVAEAGGPSPATIWKLENAHGPGPKARTLRLLDAALGWPPGHARGVLFGEELSPTPDRVGPLHGTNIFELTIDGHQVIVAGRDMDPGQVTALVAAAVAQLATVIRPEHSHRTD